MARAFATVLLAVALGACVAAPRQRAASIVTDSELNGRWKLAKAELGGKDFAAPGFLLEIDGNRYRAGVPPPVDHGTLVLFGDELAGEPRRIDVVGESGPNKGKRIPAIYRLSGRDLEICYDLGEQERPREFASRAGTQLLRATYTRL